MDLSESVGLRPGAPSFGRPQAIASQGTINADPAVSSSRELDPTAKWKSKDMQQADTVSQMAQDFFIKKERSVEMPQKNTEINVESFKSQSRSRPTGFKQDQFDQAINAPDIERVAFTPELLSFEPMMAEEGAPKKPLMPKGSLIDRVA